MKVKSCAIALEWYLRKNGKFEGSKISTKQVDKDDQGNLLFDITEWEVEGMKKPTATAVNKIIADYENSTAPAESVFNTDKMITSLSEKFSAEDTVKLMEALFVIKSFCAARNFTKLKSFMAAMIAAEKATEEDVTKFAEVLAEQNINLEDY